MGHSPLVRIDRAETEPAGRDTAALGPSDSSDSGSDLAGFEALDVNDPSVPVDVALRDDVQRSPVPTETQGDSDAAGTGERRSAASDASAREAADISVDRVFDPANPDLDEDEDPDLGFVDRLADVPAPVDEDGVTQPEADAERRLARETALAPADADALERVLGPLVDDHTRVKSAYEAFRELVLPADAERAEAIVEQVLFELQVHAALEEELLYPAARTIVDSEELLDEAEVEHEAVHGFVGQLVAMNSGDEKYAARFAVLCEYVLHHVREEEGKLFPKLRRLAFEWEALADAMEDRREELLALAESYLAETPRSRLADGDDDDGRYAAYDAAVERDDLAAPAAPAATNATTDTPDESAPEPRREHPATGIASHGSASSRKI
jgi:hemerythrin superfamily protein